MNGASDNYSIEYKLNIPKNDETNSIFKTENQNNPSLDMDPLSTQNTNTEKKETFGKNIPQEQQDPKMQGYTGKTHKTWKNILAGEVLDIDTNKNNKLEEKEVLKYIK